VSLILLDSNILNALIWIVLPLLVAGI
jgi:hypothetical protein